MFKNLVAFMAAALLVGGGIFVPPAQPAHAAMNLQSRDLTPTEKAKYTAWSDIGVNLNDRTKAHNEITVTQGTQAWVEWQTLNTISLTAGISDLAKFNDVTPLNEQCNLDDSGKPVPCKRENNLWAITGNTSNMIQHTVYANEFGLPSKRSAASGKRDTFRHKVNFDTVGKVFVTLDSVNIAGKPEPQQTLVVNVVARETRTEIITVPSAVPTYVPVPGPTKLVHDDQRVFIETQNIYGQNLFDETSDEGTAVFSRNRLGLKLWSPQKDRLGAAVVLEGGGAWSPMSNGNLFAPGDDAGSAFGGISFDLFGAEYAWRFSPFVHIFGKPSTGEIFNPGFRAGMNSFMKFDFFGITPAKMSAMWSTDFTDIDCNTGSMAELGIGLFGYQEWAKAINLYLLLGSTAQGKLTDVSSFSFVPYAGLALSANTPFDSNISIGVRVSQDGLLSTLTWSMTGADINGSDGDGVNKTPHDAAAYN